MYAYLHMYICCSMLYHSIAYHAMLCYVTSYVPTFDAHRPQPFVAKSRRSHRPRAKEDRALLGATQRDPTPRNQI